VNFVITVFENIIRICDDLKFYRYALTVIMMFNDCVVWKN